MPAKQPLLLVGLERHREFGGDLGGDLVLDGEHVRGFPSTALPASGGEENLTMEEIERRAILGALEKTGGNRTRAAGLLGIGLRTLQRKLKEYRLAGKT